MKSVTDDQLADWCRAIQGDDREALAALFDAGYPALVRYARSLTRETAVRAEDVAQEAFIRLWKRRATLDADRSVQALLYTMVRRQIYNETRDTANRKALLDDMSDDRPAVSSESKNPAETTDAELLGARLRRWIGELPERRQEAFRLSRFDQLSYQEIADVMDVSVRTVENHVRLALQQLRDKLRAFEPERLGPQ